MQQCLTAMLFCCKTLAIGCLNSTVKEKSGLERTKKRGPLLLHCQQGPVALVHLPLHYTDPPSAHSLLSFPILSIWFSFGSYAWTSSAAAFCWPAAQRGALGPAWITELNWLWAHFLTGLVRSCSYSEIPKVGLIKLNNTFLFIICWWSTQARVFSGDLEVPVMGNRPGSTLRGKRKDKYAAFQPTTTAFTGPHIIPCSLNVVVLELIKPGRRIWLEDIQIKKKGRFLHHRSSSHKPRLKLQDSVNDNVIFQESDQYDFISDITWINTRTFYLKPGKMRSQQDFCPNWYQRSKHSKLGACIESKERWTFSMF